MRFTFLIFFVLLLTGILCGQQNIPDTEVRKRPNDDASGAIEITDSIYGPVNVSTLFGSIQELTEGNTIEHSSAWFKFTMAYDTLLTLSLIHISEPTRLLS